VGGAENATIANKDGNAGIGYSCLLVYGRSVVMKWPVLPVSATAKGVGGEQALTTGVVIGNVCWLSLLWLDVRAIPDS
jgi:hypothetical protein